MGDPLLPFNSASRRRRGAKYTHDGAIPQSSAADPVAAFLRALSAWNGSLKAYLAAIRAYMQEAGTAGPRSIGTRWAAAERALETVEHSLEDAWIHDPLSRAARAEGQSAEGQSAEGHLAEGHLAEGHSAEGQSAEGHLAEGHLAEGHLAEGQSAEGQSAEGQSAVIDGAGLENLMTVSDAVEAAVYTLNTAASTALDPNVQVAALVGMSRTYSESLKSLGRTTLEAGLAAAAHYRDAVAAAGVAGSRAAGLPVGAITAAYNEKPDRRGVATELYVSALLCRAEGRRAAQDAQDAQEAQGALGALEMAKDLAFGITPDTAAAAAADTAVLAEYHPLQAMAYAPAAFGPPHKLKDADGVALADGAVDLGLPQARLAVSYDLAPLVDRQRALAHGPLASTITGLNYRLIERLRTIRAEPYKRAEDEPSEAARLGPNDGLRRGPLTVTTDGQIAREFAPLGAASPEAPEGTLWAPFAGARPRVGARSDAEAAVILAGIRLGRANGWGLNLQARYEAAVQGELLPSGECSKDGLLEALVAAFEKVYDAAPPESPRDFRNMVVPEAPTSGSYLCAAVVRISSSALDARLQALHFRPAAIRAPHAVVAREAWITQAIQAVEAGRKLWRRFKEAGCHPDPEAFALPADQKKTRLMKAFRRIATDVAQADPLDCLPPTLKGFASMEPRPL